MDNQYIKETIYKDVQKRDRAMAADSNQISPRSGRSGAPGGDSSRLDESDLQQDYVGFKEGKNELGQVWKEDW